MASKLQLPSKKEDLAKALKSIVHKGERARNLHQTTWYANLEYLRGNRQFDELNYRDGIVRVSRNDTTCLDFRYEEAVRKLQDEVGKLLRMNTLPKVGRRQLSLDSVRQTAVAQLVMDGIISPKSAEDIKLKFLPLVAQYGTAALMAWVEPVTLLGAQTGNAPPPDIEVVPPWELLCVPAEPKHHDQVTAVIRSRWVAMKWLETLGFKAQLAANSKKIIVRTQNTGQTPTAGGSVSVIPTLGADSDGSAALRAEGNQPETDEFVKLNEMWIEGRPGVLARYIVFVDELILKDDDFSNDSDPPLTPIGVARYIDVGGFYGRGLADIIVPINIRNEAALDNLYRQLEELRLFGTTFVPASFGISPSVFEGTDVPRLVTYEPDYTVPSHVPTQIAPKEVGSFPGDIAKMGIQLLDRLCPPNVMDDKGRVDSARGLGYLQELSTIPMTYSAMSIASCYATVYAALLDKMRRLWPSRTVAVQSFLDDALAGISIDPKTGQLTSDNQIPRADVVDIGIASATPVSPEQQKRDLYDMLQGQLIDKRWFRILSRKMGLNLPVANEAEWENYRKAMLNNIILFGDGQKPGEGAMMSESDLHDLHLQVMTAFMSRPEFTLASVEVRDRFQKALQMRKDELGQYPQQLPYPDQMMPQGGPGGQPQGMPPQGMPTGG
jgi:hypothetical protein